LDAIAKREFNFAKNGFLIAEIIKGVNKILFVQTNLTWARSSILVKLKTDQKANLPFFLWESIYPKNDLWCEQQKFACIKRHWYDTQFCSGLAILIEISKARKLKRYYSTWYTLFKWKYNVVIDIFVNWRPKCLDSILIGMKLCEKSFVCLRFELK
jgi:hypothetical protein